jgi:hypothetical protein
MESVILFRFFSTEFYMEMYIDYLKKYKEGNFDKTVSEFLGGCARRDATAGTGHTGLI